VCANVCVERDDVDRYIVIKFSDSPHRKQPRDLQKTSFNKKMGKMLKTKNKELTGCQQKDAKYLAS